MANSAGGRAFVDLYNKFKSDFIRRVKAVAFADAYYHKVFTGMSTSEKKDLAGKSIHFKCYKQSHKDLGYIFQ